MVDKPLGTDAGTSLQSLTVEACTRHRSLPESALGLLPQGGEQQNRSPYQFARQRSNSPHLDHQDCHIDSYSGVLDLRQVCYGGLMTGLFKSHLSHDCFESWLRAKLVEPGIDFHPDQQR